METSSLEYLEEQITQMTASIWDSIAGLNVRRLNRTVSPDEIGHALAGCVRIDGAWEGAVVLHCSSDLSARAAKTMLGVDPSSATKDDLRDALGELVNMTGGNIKTLMPGPSHLSLPVVAEGNELTLRVPKSKLLTRLGFECDGQVLLVSILEGKKEDPK